MIALSHVPQRQKADSNPDQQPESGTRRISRVRPGGRKATRQGTPRVGDRVAGKYDVVRVVGVGVAGVVVEAKHARLGRKVAIKFLSTPAAFNNEQALRFEQEARALATIQSENVVRVHDVDTLDNGIPYIVMEYVDGKSLEAVIAEGRLSVECAVSYTLQVAEAMAVAHKHGIVHRDLKPSNLMVTKAADGRDIVKVLDFGIAKDRSGKQADLTRSSEILGSPLYMAPEQLTSPKCVDLRSDVWALGVILFELLTGKTPFTGPNVPMVYWSVLRSEPTRLRELRHEMSAGLEAIVARCMRKDPALRYQTLVELACALSAYGGPRAKRSLDRICRVQGVEPPPSVRTSRTPRRRSHIKTLPPRPCPDATIVNRRRPRADLRSDKKEAGFAPGVAVVVAILACLLLAAAGIFFADSLRTGASPTQTMQRSDDGQQRTQRSNDTTVRELDANAELANW